LAAGFFSVARQERSRQGRLVELAPQRRPVGGEELGPAATTSLFDVKAQGHSFVYLIDGSASMGQGGAGSPLEALKEPLRRSITDLHRNHRFQVFVFDRDTRGCVATDQEKPEGLA